MYSLLNISLIENLRWYSSVAGFLGWHTRNSSQPCLRWGMKGGRIWARGKSRKPPYQQDGVQFHNPNQDSQSLLVSKGSPDFSLGNLLSDLGSIF